MKLRALRRDDPISIEVFSYHGIRRGVILCQWDVFVWVTNNGKPPNTEHRENLMVEEKPNMKMTPIAFDCPPNTPIGCLTGSIFAGGWAKGELVLTWQHPITKKQFAVVYIYGEEACEVLELEYVFKENTA